MTLLKMVQKILSDMDSDNVNSISDTEESLQIAEIVENSYEYLTESYGLASENKLLQILGLGDTTKPTHMQFPEAVREICWIKYNKETTVGDAKFEEITYMDPTEFHKRSMMLVETDTNVISVTDSSGLELFVLNDRHPTHWTTFDEEYIVFNAYDVTVDSTLQQSKVQCLGSVEKTFSLTDGFIPDIPSKDFPLLLEEAKAEAFALFKEGNRRAEIKSRRQQIRKQKTNSKVKQEEGYYAFGRN